MIGLVLQGSNTQNTIQNDQIQSGLQGNIFTVKMEEENSYAVKHDQQKLRPTEISNSSINCMEEDEPRWKKYISSKRIHIADKRFPTSIHQKYSLLAKTNPRISSCIKAITQQIKLQILRPIQKHQIQQKMQTQTIQVQLSQKKQAFNKIISKQIMPDKAIVKESCYRGLLKPTQIDNDVPSDEQDLNNGIRYMYGQLLYSVGSQMINQRQSQKHQKTKPIAKQNKKPEYDKQNINTNLPQETKAKQKSKVTKASQKMVKPKGDISRQSLMVRH